MTPNGSTSCSNWYLKFFPRWKSMMWTTRLVSYALEEKKKNPSQQILLKAVRQVMCHKFDKSSLMLTRIDYLKWQLT